MRVEPKGSACARCRAPALHGRAAILTGALRLRPIHGRCSAAPLAERRLTFSPETVLAAIEGSDELQAAADGKGIARTTEAALDKLTRSSLVPRSVCVAGPSLQAVWRR